MARKFRSLLLAAVLLLSFAFPSGSAYADGYAGVVYGPKATAVVNPEYGVIVNAGSSFDAALYAIGYNPDSNEFTSDAKAYLSNSDTGGAFYTFAQKFTNHNDKWGDGGFGGSDGTNVGINDFDLNMTTSLKMFNNMYGPSNVWCGQYSATERVAAVVSVGLVLSGEVGGGGSGGSTGSFTDIPFLIGGASTTDETTGTSGVSYMLNGDNYFAFSNNASRLLTFDCSLSFVNTANEIMQRYATENEGYTIFYSGNTGIVGVGTDTGTKYRRQVNIYFLPPEIEVEYIYVNVPRHDVITRMVGGYRLVNTSNTSKRYFVSNPYSYRDIDSTVEYVDSMSFSTATLNANSTSIKYSCAYYATGTGESTPVVPPTNWPEPDPTPTPEPPTVDPPTTPDPPNVPTTPTPPTYPPEVTYPDVTYVEADLSAVLDALNEHCEHLQNSIYQNSVNLYNYLQGTISGEFTSLKTFMRALASWNVQAMNDNFDALYTYLTDFAVWLEGCIRADDIVLLLEGIYNQMGNLDASTNDLVDLSMLETTASDISADVELIVQALNNLQDDNELLTIRGYLKGMYDWLHDFVIPDAVEVDLSTVEGYLSDISTDLDNFVHDFAVRWADLMNELDDIIDAINSINFSERRWWKPIDLPDDPTVIVPVIRLPPEYYDPTNPRLPPFIEEPDAINIPALQAAFMELMTKFPFCMLNDLLNMLLYVVRPAAAPIFDLPVPNPSDWSSPHMITIDLSIFDPCAAMLRMGITLWVGVKLARRSVKMWTNDNQEVVSV